MLSAGPRRSPKVSFGRSGRSQEWRPGLLIPYAAAAGGGEAGLLSAATPLGLSGGLCGSQGVPSGVTV